jgi:dTDP-4-dehydrorhamnose reductase
MILITGSTGFIGTYLINNFTKDIITDLTHQKKSLRNGFQLSKEVCKDLNITSIILIGGITKFPLIRNNPDLAFDVNVTQLKKTIDNLLALGIHITFISSESVFDGIKGLYSEEDETSPVFFYGYMKQIIEEHLIKSKMHNLYSILRISKVYCPKPSSNSLISQHLKLLGKSCPYPVVDDLYTNPIDLETVCNAIYKISSQKLSGIYHLGGKDVLSRKEIIEIINNYLSKNKLENYSIKAEYTSRKNVPNFEFLPFNTSLKCESSLKKLGLNNTSLVSFMKSSINKYFKI